MEDEVKYAGGFIHSRAGEPYDFSSLEEIFQHLPDCQTFLEPLNRCQHCSPCQPIHSYASPPASFTTAPPVPIVARRYQQPTSKSPQKTWAEVASRSQTPSRSPQSQPRQPQPFSPQQNVAGSSCLRYTNSGRPQPPQQISSPTYAQVTQRPSRPYISPQQQPRPLTNDNLQRAQAYQECSINHAIAQNQVQVNATLQAQSFNGFPLQQTNQPIAVTRPYQPRFPSNHSFPPGPGPPLLRLNDQVPTQAFLSADPRNIADLVQATSFRGHRLPPPSTTRNTVPHTSSPLSPATYSVTSSRTSNSRRRGSALRDPTLPHRCIECSKTFAKPDDLRRHIARTHTDIATRPYQCTHPSCPWRFINPKDLNRHLNTHLEGSVRVKYSCEVCGKTYTRADNLQRHKGKEHSKTVAVDSAYAGSGGSMSRSVSQRSHAVYSDDEGDKGEWFG